MIPQEKSVCIQSSSIDPIVSHTSSGHPLDIILNSEDGIVEVFITQIRDYLMFIPKSATRKEIYLWYPEVALWKEMSSDLCQSYSISIMKTIVSHYRASLSENHPSREKLEQLLGRLEKVTFRNSLFSQVKQDHRLIRENIRFNSASSHLPVANGKIVDLISGAVRTRAFSDLWVSSLSLGLSENSNPDNRTKVENYFAQLMLFDQKMIDYLQRLLGYFLTGENTDHGLYLWYGTGLNGRGTLARIVKRILGEFSGPVPSGLLQNPPSQLKKVTCLDGKRIVFINDSDDDTPLNPKTIKLLLGDDITDIKYPKIVLITETLPTVKGLGKHFRVIPFKANLVKTGEDSSVTSKSDIVQNPNLERELEPLMPDVLSWMIEGARKYYQSPNLIVPSS